MGEGASGIRNRLGEGGRGQTFTKACLSQEPPADQIPYDIDLPVKAVVYSFVGLMVSEGAPAIFSLVGI